MSNMDYEDTSIGESLNTLDVEEEGESHQNLQPIAETSIKRKLTKELFPDETKKVLIAEGKRSVDSLALTLPLPPPSLPKLTISDIGLTKSRFVFEGKILNKYGTYDTNEKYKKYLKADLADETRYGTVTLVIGAEFIPKNIDKIVVDTCIRIEGPVVVARSPSDGGSIDFSLSFDASTFILKAEPFQISLVFVSELSIRSFLDKLQKNPALKTTLAFVIIQVDSVEKGEGGVFEQLTIADGITPLDRATLTFVNKRKSVYYQLVDEFHKGIVVPYIARNIGAWQNRSRTLSILDVTLLAPLHGTRKRRQLELVFNKQISELGYGKELQGKLRVLNVNGAILVKKCRTCKSANVCVSASGGYCYSCGEVPFVDEVVRLVYEIAHANTTTEVVLAGDIVDTVLQLKKPFLSLFKEDGLEARILLSDALIDGVFFVDSQGHVIAYRSSIVQPNYPS